MMTIGRGDFGSSGCQGCALVHCLLHAAAASFCICLAISAHIVLRIDRPDNAVFDGVCEIGESPIQRKRSRVFVQRRQFA